jgi:hypothetical protein
MFLFVLKKILFSKFTNSITNYLFDDVYIESVSRNPGKRKRMSATDYTVVNTRIKYVANTPISSTSSLANTITMAIQASNNSELPIASVLTNSLTSLPIVTRKPKFSAACMYLSLSYIFIF